MGSMGFFDKFRPDDDEDEDEDEDADDCGHNHLQTAYVGGALALDIVLARSADAAVALRRLVVYPDYFSFTVEAWVRTPVRRTGTDPRFHPLIELGGMMGGGAASQDYLCVGLQFPDGATVSNIDPAWWHISSDAPPPSHGLHPNDGSSSERHAEQEFRAWPVPTGGILRVVTEWPAYDIPETHYELDGALLGSAAERSQPVWPDLPPSSGRFPGE
jgi:hypothetical protein